MDKYHPFNIEQLLEESKHWKEKLYKLNRDIKEARELRSINNESGVRSTEPSKITENSAIRIVDTLQSQVDEIKKDKEMLKYAFSILTDEEEELVRSMKLTDKNKGVVVWEYGRKHGLNKDYVYRDLNNALNKMSKAIDEKYYRAD